MTDFITKMAQKMIDKFGNSFQISCNSLDSIEAIDDPDYTHLMRQSGCKIDMGGRILRLGDQQTKINIKNVKIEENNIG